MLNVCILKTLKINLFNYQYFNNGPHSSSDVRWYGGWTSVSCPSRQLGDECNHIKHGFYRRI